MKPKEIVNLLIIYQCTIVYGDIDEIFFRPSNFKWKTDDDLKNSVIVNQKDNLYCLKIK